MSDYLILTLALTPQTAILVGLLLAMGNLPRASAWVFVVAILSLDALILCLFISVSLAAKLFFVPILVAAAAATAAALNPPEANRATRAGSNKPTSTLG